MSRDDFWVKVKLSDDYVFSLKINNGQTCLWCCLWRSGKAWLFWQVLSWKIMTAEWKRTSQETCQTTLTKWVSWRYSLTSARGQMRHRAGFNVGDPSEQDRAINFPYTPHTRGSGSCLPPARDSTLWHRLAWVPLCPKAKSLTSTLGSETQNIH